MLTRRQSLQPPKSSPNRPSPVKSSSISNNSSTSTVSNDDVGSEADKGGFSSISNSDADSESDDDDDPVNNLISSLSGSGVKRSLSSLSAKRSDVFEDDRSGLKRLKLPPVVKAPFLKKNNGSLMKKSTELQQLHVKDEEEAIKSLKENKTPKDQILQKLDKKAAEDRDYVEYLALHKDNLQLDDFYFIRQAPYVKPKTISQPIELYCIPGMIRQEDNEAEFDVFNEFDNEVILREFSRINKCDIDVDGIKQYMTNLGAWEEVMGYDEFSVTEDDLEMDSKKKTQDIGIIVTKFNYLVQKIIHSDYNLEKFEYIFRMFGFFMMDRRVFNSGESNLFSHLINELIKWRFASAGIIALDSIVHCWYSLSDQLHLIRRIIESLASNVSVIIAELRRLLSLNVFLQGQATDLRFIKNPIEFNRLVNNQIYQKLSEWNKHGRDFFAHGDFFNTKVEFQCLFQCFDFVYAENKTELDQIKNEIEKLRTKVSTSFHDSEQASFKSLLLLIATVFDAGEINPGEQHQ